MKVADSLDEVIGVSCKVKKVRPPSVERFQMLLCVPVPQGPLAYVVPSFLAIRTSGSPYAWIVSTIVGLENVIFVDEERVDALREARRGVLVTEVGAAAPVRGINIPTETAAATTR
jgi:hypothetical protein